MVNPSFVLEVGTMLDGIQVRGRELLRLEGVEGVEQQRQKKGKQGERKRGNRSVLTEKHFKR